MEFMGTKTAAEKWNVTQAMVANWCRKGLIKNAEQDSAGRPWRIPVNAERPELKR